MKRLMFCIMPAVAAAMLCLASCDNGGLDPQEPPVHPGTSEEDLAMEQPEGGLAVEQCRPLTIKVRVPEGKEYDISWSWNGAEAGKGEAFEFIAPTPGDYPVTMHATDGEGKDTALTVIVKVTKSGKTLSPYVTSVPMYLPAPGQFVNEIPEYEAGDTQADMNRKALEAIGNNARGMITLGSYGGYVVCGFDHTIANVPGQSDFKVLGNAFYANANPNPEASSLGGSCEPGIVMVAYDRNKNGKADDDEWYELAGSEYAKATTVKNYEITYSRPEAGHTPVAPPESEAHWNTNAEYIPWSDNQGRMGFVYKNIYHKQDYYPAWIADDELVFTGTLLPNNAIDESGTGNYWVLYAYSWGYADNRLNTEDESNFDIGWAVDAKGNKVYLPGIDFVKIYTGVNQYCGWLGETSTEVMGVNDIHLLNN